MDPSASEALFNELISGTTASDDGAGCSGNKRRIAVGPYPFPDPTAERGELGDHVKDYNDKRSQNYHLEILSEDHGVFSGPLCFYYDNGEETLQHDLGVRNTSTCMELMPLLLKTFHPEVVVGDPAVQTGFHCCITLKQGEMERKLDGNEKPLEIALDCSMKKLATPKFFFSTTAADPGYAQSTPHQMNKFTTYLGPLTSASSTSLRHLSGSSDDRDLSMGSLNSLSPPNRSKHSIFKRHKKALELSSESKSISCLAPDAASPKHRPKSVVASFITRSLRVRKRSNTTNKVPEDTKVETPTTMAGLVSPLPLDRRITLSTVMHIYFKDSRDNQVYKSVLVSEKSTTKEVVRHALERYNMKFHDPDDFSLFEIIGRWLEVSPSKLSCNVIKANSSDSNLLSSPPILLQPRKKSSVEEFSVCYEREMAPNEFPYHTQYYLAPSEGFTRKFELRKRQKKAKNDIQPTLNINAPAAIFGQTSHRQGRKHKVIQLSLDSRDTSELSGGEAEADVSIEVMHPASVGLNCSSPDSGVGMHKVTQEAVKSSLSTEQSDAVASAVPTYSIYPPALGSASLLSLQLHEPKKELLVHRLISDTSYITTATVTLDHGTRDLKHCISRIDLHHSDLCSYQDPLVSISRETAENGTVAYTIQPLVDDSLAIHVNGRRLTERYIMRHGDLISIGSSYTFLFHDYTSVEESGNLVSPSRLNWEPAPVTSISESHTSIVSTAREEESMCTSLEQFPPTIADSFDDAEVFPTPLTSDMPPSYYVDPNSVQSTCVGSDSPTRKLMFSFNTSEEDALVSHLVAKCDPLSSPCQLAPAYIMAMCTEFSLKCNGPKSTLKFVMKLVHNIQKTVWECAAKLSQLQAEPTLLQSPSEVSDELLPLLTSLFFWLGNCLELHNYLSSAIEFPASVLQSPDENFSTALHNIIMHAFQESFCSVKKVLCHSLPVMLDYKSVSSDSSGVEDGIVIGQAVDFLEAVLDLMTGLSLHTEIVAQFFGRIFFFINSTLFNGLVNQGEGLGLFQYICGKAMRANLSLLEGWACQVGFKDAILHYLARFSSAVDLIATPAAELLQMNWNTLSEEFPVLHPAQLHFILSQYLLPKSVELPPALWTPSKDDAMEALRGSAIYEPVDDSQDFKLPTSNYVLDLTKSPPEAEEFQHCVETLRMQLKTQRKSIDIIPIEESKPSASMPTLISHVAQSLQGDTQASDHDHTSHTNCQEPLLDDDSKADPVSILECPKSFMLNCNQEHNSEYDSWISSNFPSGSQVATIPRGNRGFDFSIVEEKDQATGSPAIFVERIVPSGVADKCSKLAVGDRILAIDGQVLEGMDYYIAEKYLKEAEEETTLVLAPRTKVL